MIEKAKEWVRNNYGVLIAVVAALILGLFGGWALKPDVVRTEEKIKVVEVEKQVIVVQEKVRVEIVKVKDVQVVERYHREKTEESRPDGTKLTKETEDRNIDSVVHEKENSTEIKVVTVEKEVVVEREKIVEKRSEPVLPNWHIGALVGVAPHFDNPLDTPLLVGLEAERRVGPVWVGLWGMGGSPVVGGFKVVNASLGIKVGIEL